jgi:integrase
MKHSVKISPERRKDKAGNLIGKNVPLFADIRFSGTRLFYFTGYRIDVDKFDTDKQEVCKNSIGSEGKRPVQYNLINKRLKVVKAALELYFQGTESASKQQVVDLLNDVCKKGDTPELEADETGFFQMFEKYRIVAKLSEGRKNHIKSTMNHWFKFEAARGLKITFEGITVDLLRDFEKYLKECNTKSTMKKKPVGRNTVRAILALTRTFWNFARKELKLQGIDIHYPFGADGYQIPGETYGQPIYITADERNILFGASITSERLQRVRDVFVFQCMIGARVGDLCKLTKANIQNNTITYIPRKTKEGKPVVVSVPLHPMALEILNRYDLPDGRLLPFIADQRYNYYLKELFSEVGINRIVTRINPTTGEPEQVPLSDIVSSHMARRAFVGNLYGKVDNGIISSMSGHVAGSKAFTRYYDVSKELQQEAISKL